MATAASAPPPASTLPFPLGRLSSEPWKEQALARIASQRFLLEWLQHHDALPLSPAMQETIEGHWTSAADTAKKARSPHGASVARVTSHLDEVDLDLLRIAPLPYLAGQVPGLLLDARRQLAPDDPRRRAVEALDRDLHHRAPAEPDRETIVAAKRAACAAERQDISRLRSFQMMLATAAALLTVGAAALGVFGFAYPGKIPLCFNPSGYVVCPTSATHVGPRLPVTTTAAQTSTVAQDRVDNEMRNAAQGFDIAVVESIGLLAAALAAAISLRGIRGSSGPYSLPVMLAVLKLPTGALTAVFGLLLMRGQFIPGLSALDTSAQILAWAVLFGYSQQLLTRAVDEHAKTVLDSVGQRGRPKPERTELEHPPDDGSAPAVPHA